MNPKFMPRNDFMKRENQAKMLKNHELSSLSFLNRLRFKPSFHILPHLNRMVNEEDVNTLIQDPMHV